MRLSTILFTAILCADPVTSVFAQIPLGRSCQASADGAVTISFRQASKIVLRPVTGAPYSAVRSSQTAQTLADGTHIRNNRAEGATWRDSAGRTRIEMHTPGGQRVSPCETSLVEIDDPPAGYVYFLDPVDRIAYSLALTVPPPAPERAAEARPVSTPAQPSPGDPGFRTDSLGEKTMFGVTVTGTMRTTTYPVGSSIGNDRPVATTEEDWTSPQLNLLVYSQRTEYTGIVTTITTKDLSIAEPDPALMQVPPGYKVVDESGSFTINIPGHN